MDVSWVPRLVVGVSIPIVLSALRRLAPAPPPASESWSYENRQVSEPFPPGVIGGFMWAVGIAFVLCFFVLRWANHFWAGLDGAAVLRVYETSAIWWFFPGFAAICIPWPLTVSLLRRLGRTDEADSITDESNFKGGMNSFSVLKWMSIVIAAPVAFFTILAIPMHLSIAQSEVRVGHYGKLAPERFPLSEARRVTLVAGNRNRDGAFHPQRDLLIDFSDGRRLDANAAGDGDDAVREDVLQQLLAETHLPLQSAQTKDDIPKL